MKQAEKLKAITRVLERYAKSHGWRYNNLWWENVPAEKQTEPCYSCGSPLGEFAGLNHEDEVECQKCECRFDAEEFLQSIEEATWCNERGNGLEGFWSYTVAAEPPKQLMETIGRGSIKYLWDELPHIIEFLHITGCARTFLYRRQTKLELMRKHDTIWGARGWPNAEEWDEEDYALVDIDGKTQSELQADLITRKEWEQAIPSLPVLEITILLGILSAIDYEGTHALSFFARMKAEAQPLRPDILGDWNDPTAYRTYGGE